MRIDLITVSIPDNCNKDLLSNIYATVYDIKEIKRKVEDLAEDINTINKDIKKRKD